LDGGRCGIDDAIEFGGAYARPGRFEIAVLARYADWSPATTAPYTAFPMGKERIGAAATLSAARDNGRAPTNRANGLQRIGLLAMR
jgi:hypothetical protein